MILPLLLMTHCLLTVYSYSCGSWLAGSLGLGLLWSSDYCELSNVLWTRVPLSFAQRDYHSIVFRNRIYQNSINGRRNERSTGWGWIKLLLFCCYSCEWVWTTTIITVEWVCKSDPPLYLPFNGNCTAHHGKGLCWLLSRCRYLYMYHVTGYHD